MQTDTPSKISIENTPASPRLTLVSRSRDVLQQAGMMLVLAGLIIYFSLTTTNFFTLDNLDSLLWSVSTIGIISCTMLFCLASGNFDLSVGTMVPCAGVVAALVMNSTGSIFLAVAAALGTGALVGLANGIVVAKGKINPLITTLATMQIVKGLGFKICKGVPVPIHDEGFWSLGTAAWPKFADARGIVTLHIPIPVWICLACFLFFGLLLQWTTFGRNTLAIGGNEEAARLAGIKVDRIKIIIFTVQGMIAALAGVLSAAAAHTGYPKAFEGLELQVISACVLGGVSLSGGIGKMSFVVAGVFIMGVIANAMTLKNMEYYDQYMVSGALLLGAVLYDRFKQWFFMLPFWSRSSGSAS